MIGADRWLLDSLSIANLERYAIHRLERFRDGVSRYDAAHLKSFITEAIAEGVYKLFVHCKSYPVGMTYDEWLDTLLEIREGFANPDDDIDWTPSPEAWALLQQHFPDLWS